MLKRERTIIATKEEINEDGVVIKNTVVRVDVDYGQYKKTESFIWYTKMGDNFESISFQCATERRMKKEMGNFFA